MGKTINEIAYYFKGVRWTKRNESFQCLCPCHNDKEPSLSISKGEKDNIVLHCHAGCDTSDILSSVGLSFDDVCIERKKLTCFDKIAYYYANERQWTDKNKVIHTGYGEGVKVTNEYKYRDEQGKYLYSKVRIEGGQIDGKLIRYYTIDEINDEYKYCKKEDVKHALYRLPEFLKYRKQAQYVYIVEGEKDVETLRKCGEGFGCCTTAGGASNWQQDFAQYFKGLNVVIMRDNDSAGRKYAEAITADLQAYAHSITIINPSSLDHGDVTDYLTKEGGTIEKLKELCIKSPEQKTYAEWVYVSDKGSVSINAGILAENIRNNEHYYIVRNIGSDKENIYFYHNGYYEQYNKSAIKGMISEYIPINKRTDSLLNNVYNLLLADNTSHICKIEDFNTDKRYISFLNGLYDVSEHKLVNHTPDVLNTFQLNVRYDATKTNCPIFMKYINDLCTNHDGKIDNELIAIIQEYMGFLISNIEMEKIKRALVLWSRQGDSGKSVLIRLFTFLVGANRVASIKLTELKPDKTFILGTIPNSRMIVCGDESNSNVTDSSIFKALTGGDPVKVEPKSVQAYTYTYRGGFVFACNNLPCIQDDKGGHIFNRFMLIPCLHSIPIDKQDKELSDKIKAESDAIVIWALQGLHRLIDNGYKFTESESSKLSSDEYRQQMDNVYRFVVEYYEITHNHKDRISKTDFEDKYTRWADSDESIRKVDRKNIAGRLEGIGIYLDRNGNTDKQRHISVYRGIKPKPATFTDVAPDETPFTE